MAQGPNAPKASKALKVLRLLRPFGLSGGLDKSFSRGLDKSYIRPSYMGLEFMRPGVYDSKSTVSTMLVAPCPRSALQGYGRHLLRLACDR